MQQSYQLPAPVRPAYPQAVIQVPTAPSKPPFYTRPWTDVEKVGYILGGIFVGSWSLDLLATDNLIGFGAVAFLGTVVLFLIDYFIRRNNPREKKIVAICLAAFFVVLLFAAAKAASEPAPDRNNGYQ